MNRLIVLALLVALLSGCEAPEPPAVKRNEYNASNVSKFVDEDAGVVCWILILGTSSGISCLPLSQTRLGE